MWEAEIAWRGPRIKKVLVEKAGRVNVIILQHGTGLKVSRESGSHRYCTTWEEAKAWLVSKTEERFKEAKDRLQGLLADVVTAMEISTEVKPRVEDEG